MTSVSRTNNKGSIMKKIPVVFFFVMMISVICAGILVNYSYAASGTAPGTHDLYCIYDESSQSITFSINEPEGGTYQKVEGTNTIRNFIRSRNPKVVDFALYDDNNDPVTIVFAENDCSWLFSSNTNLTHVKNLNNVDTSRCTTMSMMFAGCENLVEADVSNFDTSNVESMHQMFNSCRKLEVIDVSGFDTSKVHSMEMMFQMCNAVKELDVSGFDTSKVDTSAQHNDGMLAMFNGCRNIKKLDLSSFDMTSITSAHGVVGFLSALSSLEVLVLGPKTKIKLSNIDRYSAGLSGYWSREDDTREYTGAELMNQYDGRTMAGTYIRTTKEGHFYRTDGSLDDNNLWEVHSPESPFKGYCINLNRRGVGTYLDRVEANNDQDIEKLLCTEEEGSTHGYAPLGSSMREALITLIYYGWPNDGAGIQEKYSLTDNEYMNMTQVAIWDFTDRYGKAAGEENYMGKYLEAYRELVSQKYSSIGKEYTLYLYSTWIPTEQNLISIMGLDDQIYGGVEVKKMTSDQRTLSGAEFTIYDEEGNEVGTMHTRDDGIASFCRTDEFMGLPAGTYSVRETAPPAGYELTDKEYTFVIEKGNEIVSIGVEQGGSSQEPEEMVFIDGVDEDYKGGGVIVVKRSEFSENLEGAVFAIYNEEGTQVTTIRTNTAGVAKTGIRDLPLGKYTIREIEAPAGYSKSTESIPFELTEDGQYYASDIQFTDSSKHGQIEIEVDKVLENGTLTDNQFKFELRDMDGNVLQRIGNDASGRVAFESMAVDARDLGYKNFTVVEVDEDKDGIQYDRHVLTVTALIVDKGEAELECDVIYGAEGRTFTNKTNRQKFPVRFLKTVLNKNIPLSGASLALRDEYGREIKSWTSEEDPMAVDLYPGNYQLVELGAPKGFDVAASIRFTVGEDGKITSDQKDAVDGDLITMKDAHHNGAAFCLKKIDGKGGFPLGGAEFRLEGTDELDQEVDTKATSGKDGIITFDSLLSGTYTLTETKAPDGYKAGERSWTVDVTAKSKISKTANVDDSGNASTNYSNNLDTSETVTLEGADKIHVRILYQTENGYDYLRLYDKDNDLIKQDMNGKQVGDSQGRIIGGRSEGRINQVDYDFEGDSVTFRFYSDYSTAAYGYFAEVSYTDVNITENGEEGSGDTPLEPEEGSYIISNEVEMTEIPVKKRWEDENNSDGKRPDSIQVKLLANGENTGKTLELDSEKGWSGVFLDIPVADAEGRIKYTIEESPVEGYKTTVEGDAAEGFTVINKYTPDKEDDEKDVTVTKTVSGGKTYKIKGKNDLIDFELRSVIPEGIEKFEIVDSLPEPLIYAKDSLKVSIDGKDVTGSDLDGRLSIKSDRKDLAVSLSKGNGDVSIEEFYGKEILVTFKCKIDTNKDLSSYHKVANVANLYVDGEITASSGENSASVLGIDEIPDQNATGTKIPGKGTDTGDGGGALYMMMALACSMLASGAIISRRRRS